MVRKLVEAVGQGLPGSRVGHAGAAEAPRARATGLCLGISRAIHHTKLVPQGLSGDPGRWALRVEPLGNEVLITLPQALRVWACWNLQLPHLGLSLGRLLPFLCHQKMIFNVPHITEQWHSAFCKAAKASPGSFKSGLLRCLLALLRRFTDTPRLFAHLRSTYEVPTVLFIANTEEAIKSCLSYPVVAVQTDFPKKFMHHFGT